MKEASKGKPVYAVIYPGEAVAPEYCTRRYYNLHAAITDAKSVEGAHVFKISVDVVFDKYSGTALRISKVYQGGKRNE